MNTVYMLTLQVAEIVEICCYQGPVMAMTSAHAETAVFIRKLPVRKALSPHRGVCFVMVEALWSSHAGLYETHRYGKLCHRAEEFHVSVWSRLSGPAMLVYMKLIGTKSSVTAPRSFMFRCCRGYLVQPCWLAQPSLCLRFYPCNIECMTVVKFLLRLDVDKKIVLLDGH
ncbi:MAG: hypothetical protein ACK5PS_12975 [Desulfopila sp.]